MHHYTHEKRFGLTVSHTCHTLSFCLPNNGYPVITLNRSGVHSVGSYPVNSRQFSTFCALVEAANALLPVLDLIFSDSEKDVLESCGWQPVNQPVEMVHDLLPSAAATSQRFHKVPQLSLAKPVLAAAS